MNEAEKIDGLGLVEHYREMLGLDTDFDEYTFSIKRGNLRRLLALYAHPATQPVVDFGDVEPEFLAALSRPEAGDKEAAGEGEGK